MTDLSSDWKIGIGLSQYNKYWDVCFEAVISVQAKIDCILWKWNGVCQQRTIPHWRCGAFGTDLFRQRFYWCTKTISQFILTDFLHMFFQSLHALFQDIPSGNLAFHLAFRDQSAFKSTSLPSFGQTFFIGRCFRLERFVRRNSGWSTKSYWISLNWGRQNATARLWNTNGGKTLVMQVR